MTHIAIWLDHDEARLFHVDAAKVDAIAIHAPKADSILVVGPSTAKLELMRHLHRNEPSLEKKVMGVETVDHPTDRQIVAYARTYFLAKDRMQ